MQLVGLLVARNEEWILDACLRVALRWCDSIVALDHASADATPDILSDLARHTGRVHVLHEPDAERWDEMTHRERTLARARDLGATHCAIIDADEILSGPAVRAIRPIIERLPDETFLRLPMRPLWRSMTTERTDDCVWTRGAIPLAFRLYDGVSWAPGTDGYQHHNRVPAGLPHALDFNGHPFAVFHAQWASWPRVRAKQVWYRMVEQLRWPGRRTPAALNEMYDMALDEAGAKVEPVPDYLWDGIADDVHGHIDLTSEPWQRGEVERLVDLHGFDVFDGLDMHGVLAGKPRPAKPTPPGQQREATLVSVT